MTGTVIVVPDTVVAAGNCYQVTVSAPATRPVQHWDAQLQEVLNVGVPKTWALHIGESFPDVRDGSSFLQVHRDPLSQRHHGRLRRRRVLPRQPVTRAQMAVFLLQGEVRVGSRPAACTGTVVHRRALTATLRPWIEELAARGITGGCGGSNYCPNNPVTRQQMAVFLLKTLEGSGLRSAGLRGRSFDDVPCRRAPDSQTGSRSSPTAASPAAAVAPPLYCPTNPNNRAQMAVFLVKTFWLQLYGN